MLGSMANAKVIRQCRQCGVTREHYTRSGGRVISPCCECQIAKSKVRQDAIRDDPGALELQRAEWKRIKKRQRLISRGEVGVATAEPVVPPGATMAERRERRRRRRAAGIESPPIPRVEPRVQPPVPPEQKPEPSRRRRRRRQPTSMENGLD